MAASQPRPGRSRPSGGTWGLLLERTRHGDTYALLLLLLLVTYFLVSLLPKATWSDVVQEIAAGLTLLLALRTSHASHRLQQGALVAVLVGFVATLLGSLEGQLAVLVKAVFGLLLLITPFVILGRVLRHETVSLETIAGALDVYVIIGLIFASLYAAIGAASSGSFFAQTAHASSNQFLYFSYATLTTVGYGDLTAATNLGRSLVVLEALVGQIFLVTTVARLVTLYSGRGTHLRRNRS